MAAFQPTIPTTAPETEGAEAILDRSEPGHPVHPTSPNVLDDEKDSTNNHSLSTPEDDGVAEKGAAPLTPEPPKRKTGFVWVLIVLSILSSTFLFALDNTIVANIQPAIVGTFDSIDKLPWLSVAFLLGASSTNLVWGKIYAQFNAKWLYVGTVLLFEAGSAMCGGANSMSTLIVGRSLAGVGGAGMYVGVMSLLSFSTTEQERPTYIGFTGLTWGAGTLLGPIIGGAFVKSSVGWRYAFYLNLFIFAAVAPIYVFLIPSISPRPGVSVQTRLKHIDFVGTALIIGAFLCGTMAVSFGGIIYPWKSGRVIALFILSGLFFITFAFQQAFSILTNEHDRIFPVHFFKSYELLVLYAETSSAATSLFIAIYFLPLYFQFARGDDALQAGVKLLPYISFVVVLCVVNGGVLSKYGYYFPWYFVGSIFIIIGSALMYTVKLHTTDATVYGYTILLGIGSGAFVQSSFSVAQARVEPHEIPLAIGFITNAQISGVTIALAIANSIFLNQGTDKILAILPGTPVKEIQSALAGAGSSFFNHLSSADQTAVLNIIIASISKTYILVITAGCLALVLSLFLKKGRIFLEAGGAA